MMMQLLNLILMMKNLLGHLTTMLKPAKQQRWLHLFLEDSLASFFAGRASHLFTLLMVLATLIEFFPVEVMPAACVHPFIAIVGQSLFCQSYIAKSQAGLFYA